jgi:hypothetical protein
LILKYYLCWSWEHTLAIPPFRRLSQEDYEFKASLGYIGRICFKNKTKTLICTSKISMSSK